ncbi:LexA/Signal peptidase, partial [Sistotremastrum suecicum HHB10207 ss-3]
GIVFVDHFYSIRVVSGSSMQPTLNPIDSRWRDFVLFDKLSIGGYGVYRRGDIVSFKSPNNAGPLLVKRIVALEGDVIQTMPPYPDKEVTIPTGHVWVEGDDWRSRDSNHFGPIPLALIDAKLSWILWPLSRLGPIDRVNIRPSQTSGQAWRPADIWKSKSARLKIGHLKDNWRPNDAQ